MAAGALFHVAWGIESVPLGEGHVFRLEKYTRAARALREAGVPAEAFADAAPATWEELARVHTPDYLAELRAARHTGRTVASELDLNSRIVDAFRRMAGGSIAAARTARERGLAMHFGGGLHHAFAERPEGFCYVNDIAVAIEHLRATSPTRRAAVIDCDVHQGNGTAWIYRDDPDVFTLSLHQEDNYPVKRESDLDRGLADGTGDAPYLEILEDALAEMSRRHAPEIACYVAGADTFREDLLGGLALTKEGHAARDRLVLDFLAARSVPCFVVLAGGYARDLQDTVDIYAATGREVWKRSG